MNFIVATQRNAASYSMNVKSGSSTASEERVPVMTLDRFVDSKGIDHIDLLKLSKGMSATLSRGSQVADMVAVVNLTLLSVILRPGPGY
jgi:hypothetical protein